MKFAVIHKAEAVWLRCYDGGALIFEKQLERGEIYALLRGLTASL